MLRVKQTRGATKIKQVQRETLKGLGLGRTGSEMTLQDTPAIRGMLAKVAHLVTFTVVSK